VTQHSSVAPESHNVVPPADGARSTSVAIETAASRIAAQKLLGALGLAVTLSLALALAFAAIAHADVPDVRNCIADSNLVASPDGGFAYTVYLRDNANAPVVGATVVLDFNTASGIFLCSVQDPEHDGRLIGTSNSSGAVTFYVKAGGVSTGRVSVGTTLDVITMARPRTTDLDGDLDVDSADHAAMNALVGTSGPTGDLDKNSTVDSADVALLDTHLGGNCSATPANDSTWGAVKALYR
jgi:hypothetical protein